MVLPRGDVPRSKGEHSGSSSSRTTGDAGEGSSDQRDSGLQTMVSVRAGNPVGLPAIEKLKERINYSSWSFSMKMILFREGSWRAVKPIAG